MGLALKINRLPYYLKSGLRLVLASEVKFLPGLFLGFAFSQPIKQVKLKKTGLIFKFSTALDFLTLKEVVLDRCYENGGVKVGQNDKIIIDIGAGFGDFSISIAKAFPDLKVHAFEPDPFYFSLLKENITLNQAKNINPYNAAINSIKQVYDLIKSESCDFMKIDCEGAEFNFINETNMNYLKKIKKISMEYHEFTARVDKLAEVLQSAGFRVQILPQKQVKNIGYLAADKLHTPLVRI